MDRGGDEQQENRRQGREEDDNKYKGGVGGEEVEGEEGVRWGWQESMKIIEKM